MIFLLVLILFFSITNTMYPTKNEFIDWLSNQSNHSFHQYSEEDCQQINRHRIYNFLKYTER
jgi:hypothetical protein